MTEALGASLRAAREAKGCSLDEAERITRIRAKFLAALEADDFAALPAETQARGFLHNYAEFLGLDPAVVLAHYDEARHRKPARASATPRFNAPPAPRESPGRGAPERGAPARARRLRGPSPDVLFAIAVTIAIVLLMVWALQQLNSSAPAPTPTVPFRTTLATTAIAPTATLAPTATSTAVPLPSPQAVYVGVNLTVRAELRAWVSVKVDGVEQFAGLMKPGDTRDFVGQSAVEVSTGNGLGTRIIWNGRDQGTLGDLGQAVLKIWTLAGITTPTPTPTPTPTATPHPL
jgi:cytoskeleton protein RodZ